MSENDNNANDYALARIMNERVIRIFALLDTLRDLPDFSTLNRSYVLLANELKQIYARQPELQKAGGTICWRVMDNVELFHENIAEYKTLAYEYTNSGADYGEEHNSNVNMLCIKANIDKPIIPTEIEKLLTEADSNIKAFQYELDKMYATLSIEYVSGRPVVSVGDEKYHLSAMRDGLAQTVISYCLKHHPDKQIDIKTLKSEFNEAQIKVPGLNNLRENIRNSHFGGKNPLSPFVQAFPKVITVRKTTELSDEQLEAIKLAGS
jgi:hypothetical protein